MVNIVRSLRNSYYYPLLGGIPTYPSENDGVKVSWDDDIPKWMESHKIHVPNHQPNELYHWEMLELGKTFGIW